ncbi:MAG: thioredoxin-dependent thiol peroxidase [Leptospiraceae bacterium]|nr:thioredoxin-dependent thiol peroxidase [Leptospiraceae bacterium]
MSEIKEGKKAPKFTGVNQKGEKRKLEDLLGEKGLILYFYPKDSTPGCTQEACDFRDNLEELKKLGFNVVGVSKDSEKSHQKFIEKQNLNFELLSDTSGEICEKYGVWQEKTFMGKKSMGIVRTTFVIGNDSKILKIYPKVSVKGHVEQIKKDIMELIK